MKGILALLFLCATSQFAVGHHFSPIHISHGLLGAKLLSTTASVLSVIGSAYSDSEDPQPTTTQSLDEFVEPEDDEDDDNDEDEESIRQGKALFSTVSTYKNKVQKSLCSTLCKGISKHGGKKTEFATPNSLSFRYFRIEPKHESVNLKVQAPNDAYVALTAGLRPTDPRYEVRFGILANYQTFITRDRFGVSVATAITPQILSRDEYREFWIKWDEGTIRIGKGSEKCAFIAYADSHLFNVSYLGFSTRLGAQGTWIVEGIGSEASQ